MKRKELVIIVGPSASGKSSLQEILINDFNFIKPTNFTTRKPRSEDEKNEYVFINKNIYLEKYWKGDFLAPNKYLGNHYGTGRFNGDRVCMVVNPNGRESLIQDMQTIEDSEFFKPSEYNITCVFLSITKKLQKERLIQRGSSPSDIKKRQKDIDYFTPNKESLIFNGAESTYSIAEEICEQMKK